MRYFLAAIAMIVCLGGVPCAVLAQDKPLAIVANPEDTQFLYERVTTDGTLVQKFFSKRPSTHYETTFSSDDRRCLDVRIEANPPEDFYQGIVFDSHCKLPYVIGGTTYWVWGNLRMVIMAHTGELGLGGMGWIDTHPEGYYDKIHASEESLAALLRGVIASVAAKERAYLASLQSKR